MIKNKDILRFIETEQNVYLANVVDNRAKVRAMTGTFYNEYFWFATKKSRAKAEELRVNNNVEICKSNNMGSLRISGKLEFITDPELRLELSKALSFFSNYWDNPTEEDFILLKLSPNMVITHDFNNGVFSNFKSDDL